MDKKNKSEKELLEEINKKLGLIVSLLLKEQKTEEKIKFLCNIGLKSEEIGRIIGMTGRGVRKSKAYKE